MRRMLLIACATAMLLVVPATSALAAVEQTRESTHHEVKTGHDYNVCGNLGTFTFDVFTRTHVLDNGSTFLFDLHETYTYTLVLDDPALGTWTAHAAEDIHYVANKGGEVFVHNFNSKEGPILIIQHQVVHTDADGNVTVDRSYELVGDC